MLSTLVQFNSFHFVPNSALNNELLLPQEAVRVKSPMLIIEINHKLNHNLIKM